MARSDQFHSGSAIVLSWVGHHGRSEALARHLGADAVFIEAGGGRLTGLAPVRYARNAGRTARLLRRRRPRAVVVMMPPFPALVATLAFGGGVPVIADLHSGVFEDPRWRWALRPTEWLLRRCALSVVTNTNYAERLRQAGITVTDLHDPPEPPMVGSGDQPGPGIVLVPSSYGHDEPVDEVLAAAATLDAEIVMTGDAPASVRKNAPANVQFPGFVSRADYERLVLSASVILCLTTDENTMQRGGYEALANGVPLVTSDTEVLREFYGDAAVLVRPTAASIASGVRRALAESDDLRSRMIERNHVFTAEFDSHLEPIRAVLAS